MKNDTPNEGKGLMAMIESYPIESKSVTIKGLREAFEKIASATEDRPISKPTITSGSLLSLDDEMFSYFYRMKNVTCLCSTDSFKEIEARAIKLGIKKTA